MEAKRLRRWRANFKDELERYFAACVLDALIYRSPPQTEAVLRYLWTTVLPGGAQKLQLTVDGEYNWLEAARTRRNGSADLRIVPIVTPAELTKSGYHVARLLEKRLRVPSDYIVGADSLRSHAPRVVVFVDDFLGSGMQFHRFARRFHLRELTQRVACLYAPLAAHISGIRTLKKAYPHLHVIPGELLTEKHSLFSSQSRAFNDDINTAVYARSYYRQLRQRHRIPRGFVQGASGHLATAYVFHHAVPNNNLEILWTPQAKSWTPLFDR